MAEVKSVAKCPYCDAVLDPPPTKRQKCPACSRFIYIKTRLKDNCRVLMTEREARRVDEEWRLLEAEKALRTYAEKLGISARELEERRKLLNENLKRPTTTRGVIWSIMNQRIIELIKKEDWHNLAQLYFAQSVFLREDGRDYFVVLRKGRECNLKEYQARHVDKVEILGFADSCCPACKAMHGKVFPLSQALEKMPIPLKTCEHPSGNCRCVYAPVID